MSDWQAALVGYFIALVVAQTEAAPIAVAVSWGTAIFMVLDQAASGGSVFSSLFGAAKAGTTQTQGYTAGQQVPGGGSTVPVAVLGQQQSAAFIQQIQAGTGAQVTGGEP